MGGAKRLWGIVNFILAIGLAMTVLVTKLAADYRKVAGPYAGPSPGIRAGALSLFAVLGIPLAVSITAFVFLSVLLLLNILAKYNINKFIFFLQITFSIPFALASIFSSSSGAGQGKFCF